MSDSDEDKVLGFLITHPNSKIPAICIGLGLHVHAVDAALRSLIANGSVKGRGYASHTEQYYVPGAGEFLDNENIGKLYREDKP